MKNKLLLLAVGVTFATQMITAQIPTYVPTNGLAGWWSFSGNANDSSTNANNGTVVNATLTADRFGNTNSAYDFNGTSSHISLNNSIGNFGIADFTMSAWIFKYDLTAGSVIGKRNSTGDGNMIILSSKPSYEISSGTGDYYENTNLPSYNTLNSWFHIVLVRSGNNLKSYVNGVLIDNYISPTIHNINNSAITEIGARYSGSAIWNLWNGKIDDLGIWNRALTMDEINNLYNANICYQNITVTDTLIINTGILSYNPVVYNNTVTIYPNPAKDKITIDCGTLANVTGYKIRIFNVLGQEVFVGAMNQQQYLVPLNTWGGQGVYLVKIYDASNNLLDTKKIILQ